MRRKPVAIPALLFLVAIAAISCEGDYAPDTDAIQAPAPDRSSAMLVLTDWFEKVYAQQDSAGYAEMLDAQFQFEFLPADADSLRAELGQFNYWGRVLDLHSIGALFRTDQVTAITLDIRIDSNTPYEGGDCTECRVIESTISLRVGTTETTGGTPRTYAVDSPQTFVVKPDPNAPGNWVIFRQFDRPRGLKWASAASPATESNSWGKVKALFTK